MVLSIRIIQNNQHQTKNVGKPIVFRILWKEIHPVENTVALLNNWGLSPVIKARTVLFQATCRSTVQSYLSSPLDH